MTFAQNFCHLRLFSQAFFAKNMRKLFRDHKNDITKIFVSTLSAIYCTCTVLLLFSSFPTGRTDAHIFCCIFLWVFVVWRAVYVEGKNDTNENNVSETTLFYNIRQCVW